MLYKLGLTHKREEYFKRELIQAMDQKLEI